MSQVLYLRTTISSSHPSKRVFFLCYTAVFPSAFQLQKLTTCINTAVASGSCLTHGAHLRVGCAAGDGQQPADTEIGAGAGKPKRGRMVTSPREGEEREPEGSRRLPFPGRTTRWLRAGWPGARRNPRGQRRVRKQIRDSCSVTFSRRLLIPGSAVGRTHPSSRPERCAGEKERPPRLAWENLGLKSDWTTPGTPGGH